MNDTGLTPVVLNLPTTSPTDISRIVGEGATMKIPITHVFESVRVMDSALRNTVRLLA